VANRPLTKSRENRKQKAGICPDQPQGGEGKVLCKRNQRREDEGLLSQSQAPDHKNNQNSNETKVVVDSPDGERGGGFSKDRRVRGVRPKKRANKTQPTNGTKKTGLVGQKKRGSKQEGPKVGSR